MTTFEEKLELFVKSINEISANTSIPKLFKPFLEQFRTFATDVSQHFGEMDNTF